jgi:hypothetical protein
MPDAPKRKKPFRFPISFDELLRYLMPRKRPEDRMRFFRAFVVANIKTDVWVCSGMWKQGKEFEDTPEPSDQRISIALNDWKSRTYEEKRAEQLLYDFFGSWFAKHTRGLRHRRALAAAAGRWKAKQKPKAS